MSLRKNIGSQFVCFRVYAESTDVGTTGDAANLSMLIGLDGAAVAAATNTPTELSAAGAPGWYQLELTQAETNANSVIVIGESSTANLEVSGAVYHTFQWSYDGVLFDEVITNIMSALFGVAIRSATNTVFMERDGTTTQITVTHDNAGNRTASTLA